MPPMTPIMIISVVVSGFPPEVEDDEGVEAVLEEGREPTAVAAILRFNMLVEWSGEVN